MDGEYRHFISGICTSQKGKLHAQRKRRRLITRVADSATGAFRLDIPPARFIRRDQAGRKERRLVGGEGEEVIGRLPAAALEQ